MTRRARWDGLALVGIGAVATMCALTDAPAIVNAIVGLPLLLVAPGYGAQQLLLPASKNIGWPERLVLTVVGSVAAVVALGLVLQLTPRGIDRTTVGLVLGGLAMILGALLSLRERPSRRIGVAAGEDRRRPTWRRPRSASAPRRSGSRSRSRRPRRPARTTARRCSPGSPSPMASGSTSSRPSSVRTAYVLRVAVDGASAVDLKLALQPGERWSRTLRLLSGLVDVRLFLASDARAPYRRLLLRRAT